MPAPKTKSASTANGTAKGKTPSTSGTATPVTEKDTSENLASFAGGRPDKKVYDAEQTRIKSEIDALQAKLVRPSLFPICITENNEITSECCS